MPTPHWPKASTVKLEDWGGGSNTLAGSPRASGRILSQNPDGSSECGLWSCTPGSRKVTFAADEFCHFLSGRGTYVRENGEEIPVEAGTLVFFPAGWAGTSTHHTNTDQGLHVPLSTFLKEIAMTTPIMQSPLAITDLVDWGVIPTMIEGESHTSGKLLYKGPEGRSECGLWVCTPGKWHCHVTRDEFCHFLEGRCTYVHESGEVIQIEPDTAAFFPQNWKGVCTVHETIKKVYMIR
ncbi:cupin domain-containing protein [Mesorhizobium sp. C386A]|nr:MULTISPECIES: cupin domain-containing protein [unclassified Mesorhizobium]